MSAETSAPISRPKRQLAEDAVTCVARAMKNVSFYDVSHPMVSDVVAEVVAELNRLLEDQHEFVIKFTNGYVVIQGRPVLDDRASIGNLLGACHRRGVESIVFRHGVKQADIAHLVEVLAAEPADVEASGGVGQALASRGVRGIALERLVSDADRSDSADEIAEWRWAYTTALDVLRGAAAELRTGHPIDVASVQSSVRGIVDDILGERSIVHNLNSMKGMDEYTFVHALHICILAIELGREVALSRDQLEQLGTATLLHDVGKIFVPLTILRKPARLDEAEFATISRHPVDGALVLARESELTPVASVVAFEHHMHLDHSGYPKMHHDRQLNLYSLMAGIADVYDALTTMRPYRPPIPPHQAVQLMRDEYAGRLEPRLLESFLQMLGPHPSGSLLRLPDDRLAVVTRPNSLAPDNPLVRIIEFRDGAARAAPEERSLHYLTRRLDQIEVLDPVSLGIDLSALLQHATVGGIPAQPNP